MPWNKDGSRKAFYKKSYKKSGFKMKKHSSFKLNNDKDKPSHDEEKYPTRPLKPGEGEVTSSVVPFVAGPGKGLNIITDTFTKIAKNRAKTSKIIKKIMKNKGRKFIDSPKSKSRGNFFGRKV